MSAFGDPARLEALARTELLDSGAEEVFDRLARLAARLLEVPIAQITLLDEIRLHVKGTNVDLGEPVAAEDSYCRHVVDSGEAFIVADVRWDVRFEDPSPLVEARLIAYCGVPLIDSAGHTLGALCAMHDRPREWQPDDVELLREVATAAMAEIELRVSHRSLERAVDDNATLHERHAYLAKVVEDAHDAIGSVDRDGRITAWNHGCERIYGHPAGEAIGRLIWEVVDSDPVDGADGSHDSGVRSTITRALAGETLHAAAVPRRHRAGHVIHLDLTLAPMRDAAGAVIGVTATAHDVSENRRLVEELTASELRARRTFDDAPTGITLIAPDRTLIDANRAFCEMTGFRREELVGRTMEHLTHPDDHGNDVTGGQAMLAGEISVYSVQKRYVRRDGGEVRVSLSASLVRDEDGGPRYFIVHTEDVTAAREAQAALVEARGLLDESQAVARIGSWSLDLSTSRFSWSRELRLLHGMPLNAPDPTPAQLLSLVVEEDRATIRSKLLALTDDPRDFEGEYRVALPDGSIRTLWSVGRMIAADPATGRGPRLLGTTRDVSVTRAEERSRRAIEERHGRLLAALPDTMVALYDTDLRCQLQQGGLIAEAGIDATHYVGRRLQDTITDEQSKVLPPLIERALAGESTTIDHDTGHGRQFQIEVAPYHDEDGAIVGAFTVWREITARLAREEELRLLATMLRQSEDAIIAMDADGTIVEWNGGAQRLYGHTREQAVGRSVQIIIPPERDGEDRELLTRALNGESVRRDTTRMRRDGSRVDVSLTVSPLSDASGSVNGALVIARDIGDRLREQAARREAEDRLRVTVEHAPIGVALVDLDGGAGGRLLSVNPAFAALLDDPDPVHAGVSLSSGVHPDDVPALRADLALLAAADGARTESELRCLHADGRIAWLLVTGSAVPAPAGGSRMAVLHALDIGERKRFEGRLQHLADHDALTGLANRRRLQAELERAVSLVDHYAHESALLMIDLDGFKHINDTMGHSYGDELLMRIASCLRSNLRDTDVIARLGGDEFAVVLAVAPADAASLVAENLRQAIAQDGTVVSDRRHASVTASIGVVAFAAGDGRDADTLLIEADAAMYAAKEAGRDRVAVAPRDSAGRPLLTDRRSWLTRLREALDRGDFELYAQPIRSISAPGPDRYELLLRMRGEDGEVIAPAAFLPHAERVGLIGEIDRWVFARAVEMLAARTGTDVSLSVNMSGRTLGEATLLDDLRATVSACPIPPDRLIVEVTETAAIVDIHRAREVANGLRALGCRLALDDFGSGFASFYYLKHLGFDYLKIDGEFVRALADNPSDRLVVGSVVELAREFGAQTIAEYVGDAATTEVLRELGVDYGQGFHLGRPAPALEVLPPVSRPRAGSRA